MIKTILFDVDGTLIDTEQIILKSLQETLQRELDLTVNKKDLKFVLGIPGKDALKEFIDSEDEIEKFHAIWSDRLNDIAHQAPVFNQTKEVLEDLKSQNYNLGIVTSKLSKPLQRDLSRLDLEKYFDVAVTPEDTEKHKPHPDPILYALDHFNAKPEESIYIGDSVYDFRSAQNSKAQFALAVWGAHEHEAFDQVKVKLKKPKDLLYFLDNNETK